MAKFGEIVFADMKRDLKGRTKLLSLQKSGSLSPLYGGSFLTTEVVSSEEQIAGNEQASANLRRHIGASEA